MILVVRKFRSLIRAKENRAEMVTRGEQKDANDSFLLLLPLGFWSGVKADGYVLSRLLGSAIAQSLPR